MTGSRKPTRGVVLGDSFFDYDIVGEAAYQSELASIAGGKTDRSAEKYCAALLIPEPTNPHDKKAVAVFIRGLKVGYIRRGDCAAFHKALRSSGFTEAACESLIVGGWLRKNGDEGHFGVKLNAELPFEIVSPEEYAEDKAAPASAAPIHYKPKRGLRLSARQWLALGILAIFGYALFQTPATQTTGANVPTQQIVESKASELSAEQQAAIAKRAADDAKKEAEFQFNVTSVRQLRKNMKNPASFALEQALRMDDGTLCLSYRGTNSFNAVVPGQAIVTKTRIITSDSNGAFGANWRKLCQGKTGVDVTYLRRAL